MQWWFVKPKEPFYLDMIYQITIQFSFALILDFVLNLRIGFLLALTRDKCCDFQRRNTTFVSSIRQQLTDSKFASVRYDWPTLPY